VAIVTYYVALPFVRTDDGEIVAGEPMELSTAGAAVREAQRMAMNAAGAVAFSRTGDPALGEFDNAVVIHRFGEVDEAELMRTP
jgi:hypothetical protein